MVANGNRLNTLFIWFLFAVCAGLLAWMVFGINLEFARLSRAGGLLDLRFSGYEPKTVSGLRDLLAQNEMAEARAVLRSYYTGPDMILPLAASLLGVLLLLRFAPGNVFFGRPLTPGVVRILCLLPIGYAIADYVENFIALSYFPPAEPGPWLAEAAPKILPWVMSFKFAFLLVTIILVVRFMLLRYIAPAGTRGSK